MSAPSFFFYDLETSGFYPRTDRIMQFGGQRTDLNLVPIGPAHDHLIKLTKDVLPDPQAVLITGITPQMTLKNGVSEAEFLKLFYREIAVPGTIFVGFNSIRFDDEFMRFLHYRNYYDPYEWHWSLERGRWDLLDVVRMTRALRPTGVHWPFDSKGAPSNQLGLLTAINNLAHDSAHDALDDVRATIAMAELIKSKQPKLWDWLLKVRDKREVAKVVESGEPFIYTSGKYRSEFEKTTAAIKLADHPDGQGALVYDLRYDPLPFAKLSPPELAKAWRYQREESALDLPVKTLKYNRCPAVAPLSVLDKASQARLKLNKLTIKQNLQKLRSITNWPADLISALKIMDKDRQTALVAAPPPVESRLYDDFFEPADQTLMRQTRLSPPEKIANFIPDFKDDRLKALWLPYKARNFPEQLAPVERQEWQQYKDEKVADQVKRWLARFKEVEQAQPLSSAQRDLLKELRSWAVTPEGPEQKQTK